MAEEKIIFSAEGILVSNTRVVIGSTTYSVANITSVSMEKIAPTVWPSFLIIAIGGGIVLCTYPTVKDSLWSLIFGLLVAVLGVLSLLLSKSRYSVTIATAAGQQRAMESRNIGKIQMIVAAVNEAIVRRG